MFKKSERSQSTAATAHITQTSFSTLDFGLNDGCSNETFHEWLTGDCETRSVILNYERKFQRIQIFQLFFFYFGYLRVQMIVSTDLADAYALQKFSNVHART